uniref:Uncharacterized protein n=1 Tax=viral metagenome TaxID=1070528 RepID=A0A6C0JB56_9ZZZZ
MYKEVVFILLTISYLIYLSIKNWGNKYNYRPIDKEVEENFFTYKRKHEDQCRQIIEKMFQLPFPKCRPNFLKNPSTKRNLELDCYNPDIITSMGKGLAWEYDGEQHYVFVPKWHIDQEGLERQEFRDRLKEDLCLKNGTMLIRIPFYIKNKEEFIREKIFEKNLFHYIN